MTVYISFPGNSSDIENFGGTPYFMGQGLKTLRSDVAYLDLPRGLSIEALRYAWNLGNIARMRGQGGFQYSQLFLNQLWRAAPPLVQGDIVISIFQMMGERAFASQAKTVFYIDQTLAQNFDIYGTSLPDRICRMAIEDERRGYERADLILCKTPWAADGVAGDYGISRDKIAVVLPGANVPSEFERYFDANWSVHRSQVRFLFIGKAPIRKGVLRFLDAINLLGQQRSRIQVDLAGFEPEQLPAQYVNMPGVRFHGFIDKKKDLLKFCRLLQNADVGLLLSTAEAGGQSMREFQLAGLAVIAPKVGGSYQLVTPGAAEIIDPTATPADIASVINRLIEDPTRLEAMKAASRNARHTMTWVYAAEQINRHISAL